MRTLRRLYWALCIWNQKRLNVSDSRYFKNLRRRSTKERRLMRIYSKAVAK